MLMPMMTAMDLRMWEWIEAESVRKLIYWDKLSSECINLSLAEGAAKWPNRTIGPWHSGQTLGPNGIGPSPPEEGRQ
jgi:hypothetical protein